MPIFGPYNLNTVLPNVRNEFLYIILHLDHFCFPFLQCYQWLDFLVLTLTVTERTYIQNIANSAMSL